MTKNDKFRDVASRRMKTAVRSIRLLAKCGNRRVYQYTRNEVYQLIVKLQDELAKMEHAFQEPEGDFEFNEAIESIPLTGFGGAPDGSNEPDPFN